MLLTLKTYASRSSYFALATGAVLLLMLAAGGVWSISQVAMVPSAVPPSMAVEDSEERAALATGSHTQLRLSAEGPQWKEITETQRQVLMPLHARWSSMGALTKRRWLVLADRYPKMDETERTKLVSRMNTWASLSTQQRNQARLNFSTAQRLSAKDLQTKWDEYQALSAAEKQKLAEQARNKTKAAKKSKRRLARVPISDGAGESTTRAAQQPSFPSSPPATAAGTPQSATTATPSSSTPPTDPVAASMPVFVPQASPHVELAPLPDPPESQSSEPAENTVGPDALATDSMAP